MADRYPHWPGAGKQRPIADILAERERAAGGVRQNVVDVAAGGTETTSTSDPLKYFFDEKLTETPPEGLETLKACQECMKLIIGLLRNQRRGPVLGSPKSFCEHLGCDEQKLKQTLAIVAQHCGGNTDLTSLLRQVNTDINVKSIIYRDLLGGRTADTAGVVITRAKKLVEALNQLPVLSVFPSSRVVKAIVAIGKECEKPATEQHPLAQVVAPFGFGDLKPFPPDEVDFTSPILHATRTAPAQPGRPGAPRAAGRSGAPATPARGPRLDEGPAIAELLNVVGRQRERLFLEGLFTGIQSLTNVARLGELAQQINAALETAFGGQRPLGTELFLAKRRGETAVWPILEKVFPVSEAEWPQVAQTIYNALKDLPGLKPVSAWVETELLAAAAAPGPQQTPQAPVDPSRIPNDQLF